MINKNVTVFKKYIFVYIGLCLCTKKKLKNSILWFPNSIHFIFDITSVMQEKVGSSEFRNILKCDLYCYTKIRIPT